jgi:beta-glucosidase-like glycosyl hydrolase
MNISPKVDNLLGSMTLEEKAGQVFVFTFINLPQAINDLQYSPGGYVRIYSDALTAARQNEELQARSAVPLIISADFERGIGSTITCAIDGPGNMCLGAADDEQLTYRTARAIAEETLVLGVNANYVPVLDVNVNELNPIINIRSFGKDPELVARHGTAFVRGTQDTGVIACGKHFPGHGDTQTDTHTSLGIIEADRNRLQSVELLPFRAAIEAGMDCIMSAHLWVPAFEKERVPATMSRRIMHELLREELQFKGVTVSDALDMGGVTREFPPDEAIVRAMNAGIDQLIMPMNPAVATRMLVDAVRSRKVSEARLDEAVSRILSLKEKRGIFDKRYTVPSNIAALLNTESHQETALQGALAGITLVKNSNNVLPLGTSAKVAVISFSNSEESRTSFLEPKTFAAHAARHSNKVTHVSCGLLDNRAVSEFNVIQRSLDAAGSADAVIMAAYVKVVLNRGFAGLEDRYIDLVKQIAALGKPVVFISFGNPYLLKQFPFVDAYVCAYGASEASEKAAAVLSFGGGSFSGRLPVSITLD